MTTAIEYMADNPDKVANPLANILVVDDNLITLKIAEAVLRRKQYNVTTATNGKEALELLQRKKPDIILLDSNMPVMNGYELCRQVREDSSYDHIPIIFVTADASSENVVKAFKVGGNDYIVKPAEPTELLARINLHLDLARSHRLLALKQKELEALVAKQKERLLQIRTGQEKLFVDPAAFADLNIVVRFQPAYEAGGDFYDIVQLSQNDYGLIVADIAGHDLSSTYLTGALKALTASFTNETLTPSDTILMFNNTLIKFLGETQYATMCYVKYARETGECEIINAGHPYPILLKKEGRAESLAIQGDILGMYDTITCETRRVKVEAGDRLYLFTDGIIEGYSQPDGTVGSRRWGTACLTKQIIKTSSGTVEESSNYIFESLLKHCHGHLKDDILLMVMEF